MGYIEEFTKLRILYKGFTITLIVVMPFWFASIYLFHREFFLNAPIFISIIFSYCFALIWLIISLGCAILGHAHEPINTENQIENAYQRAGFIALMSICLIMASAYIERDSFFMVLAKAITIGISMLLTFFIFGQVRLWRKKKRLKMESIKKDDEKAGE